MMMVPGVDETSHNEISSDDVARFSHLELGDVRLPIHKVR